MASFGNALAGALKGLNVQRESEEATKSKATQQLLAMLTANPALAQADPSLTQDLDPRLAQAIMGMSGVEEQGRARLIQEEEAKAERGSVRSKGLELEELLGQFGTDTDERELLAEEREGQGAAGIVRQLGEFGGYQKGREADATLQKALTKEERAQISKNEERAKDLQEQVTGELRRDVLGRGRDTARETARVSADLRGDVERVETEKRRRRDKVTTDVNFLRGKLGLVPLDEDSFSSQELEMEFGRLDGLTSVSDEQLNQTAVNHVGEDYYISQLKASVRTKVMAETGKSGSELDDHISMMYPGRNELENAMIGELGPEGLRDLEIESRKSVSTMMKAGVQVDAEHPQSLMEAADALRFPKTPPAFRALAMKLREDSKPGLEKKLWTFTLEEDYDYLAAISRYNMMQSGVKNLQPAPSPQAAEPTLENMMVPQ